MTCEWIYFDDDTVTWLPTPVTNPARSFYVKCTQVVSGQELVEIKLIKVCGDLYDAYIDITVVDNTDIKSYELTIGGIPEMDIDSIDWVVTETVDDVEDEVVYAGGVVSNPDLQLVCAEATVNLLCGCDPIILQARCYEFTGIAKCFDNVIGLDIIIEDGTYKPVRTGFIDCCIAADMIYWKIHEDDAWELLRLDETIYANEIWFKRVVLFKEGVCPTLTYEIKAK